MAFSTHDIVPDSPTNNFCTLNPLIGLASTLSDGNLYSTISGVNHGAIPNFALPLSGIWYTEFKFHSIPSGYPAVGLSVNNKIGWNTAGSETDPQSLTYNGSGGTYNFEEYGTAFSFSNEVDNINAVINTTNVYALYWNADTNKLTLYDGTNTASVDVTVNTTEPISFIYAQSAGATYTVSVNFGQDPTFGGTKSPTTTYTDANGIGAFYYQPPTGALALCTANLSEMTPTVTGDVPQDYFKCLTYSGTYSQQDIAVGFKPDLVWAKSRTQTYGHMLYDTVRGQAHLNSDTADGEFSDTQLAFHSTDGFTVSASSGELNDSYGAPNNYIAWCWKAGGAPTTDNTATSGAMNANGSAATSSNSSVSINGVLQSNYTPAGSPTIYPKRMSINTHAGFSIVSYTGTETSSQTIPHGLSQRPDFVITKSLGTANWGVWHTNLSGNSYYLGLNQTAQESSSTTVFYNFTDEIIGVGSDVRANATAGVIAYCWHSVEGYSKFGSYTGNGLADGPFVYCGFRPAFVMIKRKASTGNWLLVDTARNTNGVGARLYADLSDAEYSGDRYDQLSNGFKIRNLSTESNASSETYIYMAFAEQPFKFSNAR